MLKYDANFAGVILTNFGDRLFGHIQRFLDHGDLKAGDISHEQMKKSLGVAIEHARSQVIEPSADASVSQAPAAEPSPIPAPQAQPATGRNRPTTLSPAIQ